MKPRLRFGLCGVLIPALCGTAALLIGLSAAAFAQDEPEARLWVRATYTGIYSIHVTGESTNKVGPVTTSVNQADETTERVTLVFSGLTTWRYKDSVPSEMTENCGVSCFGSGSLRNLTKYVTAINKGGQWAPYKYTETQFGGWNYSVPVEPTQKGAPPMTGPAGSVVILPIGTYSVILALNPNVEQLKATGTWSHQIRPKPRGDGKSDTETPIDADHLPPGDPRARYLVSDAVQAMNDKDLMPGEGIPGTWDPKKEGFTASGHLIEHGGPGDETKHTDRVDNGDMHDSGLTITTTCKWTADVVWTLRYGHPPVDAVIKPQADYKTWLPEASTTQGEAAKFLTFSVDLKDKKTGDTPKEITASFDVKLLGTSKEPGSCMNSPWTDTEPDLKLRKDDNPDLSDVAPDGQSGSTKDKLTSINVYVSCFDGGAYGQLQVIAHLSDGTDVTAYLEGSGEQQVSIPYDEDGDHIADAWQKDKGVVGKAPDSDDNDEGLSPGNPNKGDGLTLWEEYRGFLEDGKWDHADPKKLNFFICDTAGGEVTAGISWFENISKLKVHSHLTPEELGTSRIINRNHAEGPHKTDQHGVLIKPSAGGSYSTVGGPGTPGMIEAVIVDPNPLGYIADEGTRHWTVWDQVARELLQCCDVKYHGEAGYRLVWWWARKAMVGGGDWVTRIYEYSTRPDPASGGLGQQVIVLGENRRPFDPDWFTSPVGAMLGIKGGLHSGSDTCVMRWFDADGYEGPGNVRYWLQDDPEKRESFYLCTSPEGTGVNAASHTPQSRYGNATHGDCADQIRVKDSS